MRYPSNDAAAGERGPETVGGLHALCGALLRTLLRTERHICRAVSYFEVADIAQKRVATSLSLRFHRPRILIDNGHLVLESGRDKNITFKVSGGGKVNFPAAAGNDGKMIH